jgi:hypothetical protein
VAFIIQLKKNPTDIYRTVGTSLTVEDVIDRISSDFKEAKDVSNSRHRWIVKKLTNGMQSIIIISEDLKNIEANRLTARKHKGKPER